MKSFITAIIFLSGFTLLSQADDLTWKAENVVIIVMDGPRYSETWGHPEKPYIPNLAGRMAKAGAVYTNFFNKGPTWTNPGHAAIVTGQYQDIDNTGKQLPRVPTLLQRMVKMTGDERSAWLVTTKDKLEILVNSSAPEWKDKYRAFSWCGRAGEGLGSGYGKDKDTFEAVKYVLNDKTPRLLIINFRQPDSYGHAKKWEKYLQGIKDSDAYIGQIFQILQTHPFYKGKTALFVTNDHGRHLDGHKDAFVSHGDDCHGCRHIMLYASGPDFKKNAVLPEEAEQIDIAVTAASILGFKIPDSKGRVLSELRRK